MKSYKDTEDTEDTEDKLKIEEDEIEIANKVIKRRIEIGVCSECGDSEGHTKQCSVGIVENMLRREAQIYQDEMCKMKREKAEFMKTILNLNILLDVERSKNNPEK